ncbi:MAG: hydroxyisourate hydrolase [Kiritimatiellae bacterium]|jgi:5-hydroxyisourate hydrolase|nr:hydroxyisourate hydrolase [Kiritimatiellia bacterium]MDD4341898.1 hydroxyisourate hydrolase [Kiritimatiellia bacterium]MDY0149512.1 hydroxyisourate hydrolase [Kiritimatiellia bacterium]
MKLKMMICTLFLAFSSVLLAAEDYQLSTHVLDTTLGKPGQGVVVTLEKRNMKGEWVVVGSKTTNEDGRIGSFLERGEAVSHVGVYRFTFQLANYFQKQGKTTVFPEAVIIFNIDSDEHYHIPLVVTPYALSTYRGS